jgi:hypothetical protein
LQGGDEHGIRHQVDGAQQRGGGPGLGGALVGEGGIEDPGEQAGGVRGALPVPQ